MASWIQRRDCVGAASTTRCSECCISAFLSRPPPRFAFLGPDSKHDRHPVKFTPQQQAQLLCLCFTCRGYSTSRHHSRHKIDSVRSNCHRRLADPSLVRRNQPKDFPPQSYWPRLRRQHRTAGAMQSEGALAKCQGRRESSNAKLLVRPHEHPTTALEMRMSRQRHKEASDGETDSRWFPFR